MPIGQIKAFAWILAAALTVGLSAYVYGYITEFKDREAKGGLFDTNEIKAALEDVPELVEQKDDLIDYQRVRGLFHEGQLNWTGYEAPPPPPPPDQSETQEARRTGTPIADILRVLMIKHDPSGETESMVWVRYFNESGVSPAPVVEGYALKVGDPLHGKYDDVKVESIGLHPETGVLQVTFSFDDEAREHESLSTEQFDATTHIVQVGEDGAVQAAPSQNIPTVSTFQRPRRRGKTVRDRAGPLHPRAGGRPGHGAELPRVHQPDPPPAPPRPAHRPLRRDRDHRRAARVDGRAPRGRVGRRDQEHQRPPGDEPRRGHPVRQEQLGQVRELGDRRRASRQGDDDHLHARLRRLAPRLRAGAGSRPR